MSTTSLKLFAHRGNHRDHPQNSLEAFESAFNNGAEGIELDVQHYQGNLYVVHDFVFDDPSKQVATGEFPTLQAVLDRFADQGRLQLDIKAVDLRFLDPLTRLLANYTHCDIEIITNVWPLIPAIRENFGGTLVGVIFSQKEFEDWMSQEFVIKKVLNLNNILGGDVVHVPWNIIQKYPGLVQSIHEAGLKLQSHIASTDTTESSKILHDMRATGIDQCTTDDFVLIERQNTYN